MSSLALFPILRRKTVLKFIYHLTYTKHLSIIITKTRVKGNALLFYYLSRKDTSRISVTLGNISLEPRDLCLTELSNVREIIPQKRSEDCSLDRMAKRFKFLASNTLQNARERKSWEQEPNTFTLILV